MRLVSRGAGGIFRTSLGDNGLPAGEGAGSGETEWVMDWASGEEARPLVQVPSGMVSALQTISPIAAASVPGGGLVSAAAEAFGIPSASAPGLTLGQVLQAQTLIPGVPNWAIGGGAVAGAAYGLWRLFGKKKGKRR